LFNSAGRGDVEHAGAAVHGGKDGVVVEKLHLEEAEARRRSIQGF